ETPAPGQAARQQEVDRPGRPRPGDQPSNERAVVQERQSDRRVAASDTTVNPVPRSLPGGQERGGDGRQVNRPAHPASDTHAAAADRAAGLNGKAAPNAPAGTSGKADLDKSLSTSLAETVTARERTAKPAAPASDTSGFKGQQAERGQQASSRAPAAIESPPGLRVGERGERPSGGLTRAAGVIGPEPGPENGGKGRAVGAQVQADGGRQAFSVAGREGRDASRHVAGSARLEVLDANRPLQADARRDGRDANRQGPAGSWQEGPDGNRQAHGGSRGDGPDTGRHTTGGFRQDAPDGNRQAQAGPRRDGQDSARPVDASAGRLGAQSTQPARVDVSVASGTGRVAACDGQNTLTIRDGRPPAGSLISAADKRYVTGAEIALAAVIAAAGAARVRPEATAGRAPDDSLSPAVTPPSDVLKPQRQPVAVTRIGAVGAQFAPDKPSGSAQGASTASLPSGEASICATANAAADKRYITGAEIALAAVIAAAGSARVRTEPVIASPADRAVVGILPALSGESRIHNGTGARNPQGSALREPTGARDVSDVAGRDAHSRPCPSANQSDNAHGALDHHAHTASTTDPGRNPSDITAVRKRIGLEYEDLPESAADSGAGVGHGEPPASRAARAPRTVLRRPTTLVAANDTLVTIAEAFFHDANLAWLIADLNRDRIKESWIDGRRVVELRNRQRLDLPVWDDIAEFYSTRDVAAASENIVTIVEECQVTRELLQSTLAPVFGGVPASASVLLRSRADVSSPARPWLGR
ncbi:MAG TPA: hypothetical protein V6D08_15290, partial [Candidatus Obscuribacterales bacterium]